MLSIGLGAIRPLLHGSRLAALMYCTAPRGNAHICCCTLNVKVYMRMPHGKGKCTSMVHAGWRACVFGWPVAWLGPSARLGCGWRALHARPGPCRIRAPMCMLHVACPNLPFTSRVRTVSSMRGRAGARTGAVFPFRGVSGIGNASGSRLTPAGPVLYHTSSSVTRYYITAHFFRPTRLGDQ